MKFEILPKSPEDKDRAERLQRHVNWVMAHPFDGEHIMMMFVILASFMLTEFQVYQHLAFGPEDIH